MKQKTKFKQTEIGKIPEDWEVKTIGEVFELSQGLQISSSLRIPIKKEGYIPLLKITDLPKREFSEFVNLKDVRDNYISSKEDIIYTRTGQVGLVYTDFEGCVHNNCFKVHYNKEKFDKLFVYYLLKQNRIFQYANAVAAGSVQKDLNHPAFKSCVISFPSDLKEQQMISEVLFNLDEKIELNNKMNKTLEAIGQAIFKKWFVEGRKDEWEIKLFGEIIKRNREQIKNKEAWEDESLIDLSNMPQFSMSITNFDKGSKFSSNIFKLNEYDILFGSIRPYFGKYGFSPINGVITGTIFSFLPKDKRDYAFCLFNVCRKEFVNYTISQSKGTKMPIIGWKEFQNFKINYNKNISKKFNDLVRPLIKKMKTNIGQNQTLSQIRDTLLPKLMSGEVRVR